ncbi:MAG: alpha/beta hydrolase, partial [Dehalococcoidia bacterium]
DKRISALVTCAAPAEFSRFTTEEGVNEFLKQCRDVGSIKDDDFPPSIEEWVSHFLHVSPINFIQNVAPRPLLIIHGEKDELIDPSHARMLFEKAGQPKELAMIPDGEHRLRINEEAMDKALDWLKRVNSLS